MKIEDKPQPAAAPVVAAEPRTGTVVEKIGLRNCQYGTDCGQRWDDLVKTELPNIRFCTRCERAVYLSGSGDELLESLQKGRCVAVPLP